ncbi:LipA and NB-ARC domain protein [Aspergillus vadensis CBS 113365]|uniref:Lipa and NB-ARC domain protein n=1 Tax=Aspergillus vadensis (strain CBS 113365 / IMI 142717 / IBT 24658) TaxID=1448311 RepID=A0A319B2E6_ASPVC|nr:lipa and NB-ARC domain protein [Aspergillus vadensis CBS 113365]PYH65901.1 lipa and NB-ARC domain protein [Aspergillus vadensis CBS 113365]
MEAASRHEFPFLEEVYSAEQPKIDFVFVHGLNPRGKDNHPFETWTHENGIFWPRDYLPQDIPQARIFVYGYNSTITNPQSMSTASVKDHANTLLNLLDLERSPQLNVRPTKIIFIGHSLGGLVIKQALLNAHEDPKYNSIRNNTSGLVFFGCPHRGTKGVELGKIAAKVARFVAKGHASNDLLDCLEHNSLFTRQMTSRFSHQLEDYRVISFVEGKEVFLGGAGPASVSHLVVDEESAVLGLPGQRETRLKLDADHSQMCKVGSRGPMYKLIKGNIKQIADQVLITEQGYIAQPSVSPHPAPPLPPRLPGNSSIPYPAAPTPQPNTKRVIGTLFTPVDNDPRSIKAAELKNNYRWDEARKLEYDIFNEHMRTIGPDHHSTLEIGYHLASIDLESGYLSKAAEWASWVSSNSQRVFDKRHPLAMKAESLMGEILCHQGKGQEGESVCANVLARQQMTIGEDDLDTLDTRRRLAIAYGAVERRQEAVQVSEKVTERLRELLGPNHIRVYASILDTADHMLSMRSHDTRALMVMRFSGEVDQLAQGATHIARELTDLLGPRHPLAIRALRLQGGSQMLNPDGITTASETFRRALANAEEELGADHPETMSIVALMGVMYASQGRSVAGLYGTPGQSNSQLATPWLSRYLTWAENRMGKGCPEVQSTLAMLGKLHMEAQKHVEAQAYYERVVEGCRENGAAVPQEVQTMLQLCRMHTRYIMPQRTSGGIQSLLSSFQRM